MSVFGQNWLYSGKVVALGQKFLSSGKSGCVWEKNSFIRAKLLYLGKLVVLGQKWFYSGKVVVFVQMFVVFG